MKLKEHLYYEIWLSLEDIKFFSSTREILRNQLNLLKELYYFQDEAKVFTVLERMLSLLQSIKLLSILELSSQFSCLSKSISESISQLDVLLSQSSSGLERALESDYEELLDEFNFKRVTPELLNYLGIRSSTDLENLQTTALRSQLVLIQAYFDSKKSNFDTIPRVIERFSSNSIDLETEGGYDSPDEDHWAASRSTQKISGNSLYQSRKSKSVQGHGLNRVASGIKSDSIPLTNSSNIVVARADTPNLATDNTKKSFQSGLQTRRFKLSSALHGSWCSRTKLILSLMLLIFVIVITVTLVLLRKPGKSSEPQNSAEPSIPTTTPRPFIRNYESTDYVTNLSSPTALLISSKSLFVLQSTQISFYSPVNGLETFVGSENLPTNSLRFGCIDSKDLIYLTDQYEIKRIDSSSTIETVAGNRTSWGNSDGLGPDSRFGTLRGLAIYQDKVYIADGDNGIIKIFDTVSSTVSTIATVFKEVYALGVGLTGDLYFTRRGYNAIYKIDLTDPGMNFTLFVGNSEKGFADGRGDSARFDNPVSISFDTSGYMYIADQNNNRIRKVDQDGNVVTIPVQLNSPMDAVVDMADNIYISDSGNGVVKKLVPTM